MPIYEYRCADCGFQKEYLQKMSAALLTDCPECGKASLAKMVTAAGFQLKGSGWYATDFKNAALPKPDAKPEDKSATKAEDKPATKAEDKSVAKVEDRPTAKAEGKPAAKAHDKSAPESSGTKSDTAKTTAASTTADST